MATKQRIDKVSPLGRVLAQRTGDWLLARLDAHLEETTETRFDPGWFHPSALGNPCDAFLAFQYMGIEGKPKTTARLRRIFDNGHARDRDVKQYLKEAKLSLIQEEEDRQIVIPHVKIRGELDDIVFNSTTRETYVFEFKTMNKDEWDKLRAPKPEHVIQVQPYMFGKGIMQVQFIYENKNNQEWKTYIQRFNTEIWRSIELRLQNIMHMVESKQLPWRTPMQNDSKCPFYHTCAGFAFKEE